MKRFLKVIDCTQQLQVRENVVGFEKALGAVKVIKDQIQYRSQSLLNLVCDYFNKSTTLKSVQSALSDLLTTSATHGTFSRPSTKRGLILIGLELNTNARESFEHC